MTTFNNKTAKKPKLRSGFTTGTCAAAAAKAALQVLLAKGRRSAGEPVPPPITTVTVDLPQGGIANIPIKGISLDGGAATAEVIKDAGDDPDVTHGTSILARVELTPVELTPVEEIMILGGPGVGTVTKPGLAVAVGKPAINPVPAQMIKHEIKSLLPPGQGARVTVSAPAGEKLASRTLNPRLGIVGGISILGTTGIVRPMSEEAYVDSLVPQINQAVALNHRAVVLTPGGMGAKRAAAMGIPGDAIVQTSNFIGIMLRECAQRDIQGVLLFGHIGKLAKIAAGIFHTHSKIADARRETLAAHAAMLGAPKDVIKEIMELNTIDASVELIRKNKLGEAYHSIAAWASRRSQEMLGTGIKIGTMMYSLAGEILGYDQNAVDLGREYGWQIRLK